MFLFENYFFNKIHVMFSLIIFNTGSPMQTQTLFLEIHGCFLAAEVRKISYSGSC